MIPPSRHACEQKLKDHFSELGNESRDSKYHLKLTDELVAHHKGVEFVRYILKYCRNHISKYYMVYVVLRRMLDDYDTESGTSQNVMCHLNPTLRFVLDRQSRWLWDELAPILPAAVRGQVAHPYSYMYGKRPGQVREG